MRMIDIIAKKRDGKPLSTSEINYFIDGYVKGEIPDYQASALLMAIYFRGMNMRETKDLTFAIRDSGKKLDFSSIHGIRVDKHSTGGVGDKTSLIVAPIVASLGVKVAKMSGRGLGHTGGTIDKLESIPGFKVDLTEKDFIDIVNDVGVCITGQSEELAPADKKLYALRDVTYTVDSYPLIISSIMGKKLAAGDDCIVLDVKTGSGAFAKTFEESKILARAMVDIGKSAGKKTMAIISDMDNVLGNAVGNALEVKEAIDALRGRGPADLEELSIFLAANILCLAGKGSLPECEYAASKALTDGTALNVFKQMIIAQGGDARCVDDETIFPQAKYKEYVVAEKSGYIYSVDVKHYGEASLVLGAGRNKKEDAIDYSAGFVLHKKRGNFVSAGDIIAELFTSNKDSLKLAAKYIIEATEIKDENPLNRPLILDIIK